MFKDLIVLFDDLEIPEIEARKCKKCYGEVNKIVLNFFADFLPDCSDQVVLSIASISKTLFYCFNKYVLSKINISQKQFEETINNSKENEIVIKLMLEIWIQKVHSSENSLDLHDTLQE
jgi:hypothetical protein